VADAIRYGQTLLYDKQLTLQLDGTKPTIDLTAIADKDVLVDAAETLKPYAQK
jgi:hypothetical protein